MKPEILAELIRNISKVFLALIKYGAYVLIAFWGYKSILALSGKLTLANVNLDSNFFDFDKCEILSLLGFLTGIGGVIYGKVQEKLRRNTVESLQGRIRELEMGNDPNRTSSHLTTRGETREDDK